MQPCFSVMAQHVWPPGTESLQLNPNFCDWRYGQCLVLLGQPEEGLVAIRRYMRLDPFFPPHALMVEGLAHLIKGATSRHCLRFAK